MTSGRRWPVAITGSGDIGTDLMLKILGSHGPLTVGAMVGIDPDSHGLARARHIGVPAIANGVEGLLGMPGFADIKLAFDATSATADRANWAAMRDTGIRSTRHDRRPGGHARRHRPRPHRIAPNASFICRRAPLDATIWAWTGQ